MAQMPLIRFLLYWMEPGLTATMDKKTNSKLLLLLVRQSKSRAMAPSSTQTKKAGSSILPLAAFWSWILSFSRMAQL